MLVKLQKSLVTINKGKNDEKSFYTFELVLPNNSVIRVRPYSYVGQDGKTTKSNYKELCLVADEKLPFDK